MKHGPESSQSDRPSYGTVLVKVEFAKRFESFKQQCDAQLDSPNQEGFNSSVLPDVVCSGVVQSICPSLNLKTADLKPGDGVVIYPSKELLLLTRDCFPSTMEMRDATSLIKIHNDNLPLPSAALLCRETFFAFSAFKHLESYVTQLKQKFSEVNVLIIGRSAVGLVTLGFLLSNNVSTTMDRNTMRVAYADSNANNVETARKIGCRHFLYWKQENYEADILATTFQEMPQGADIIINFVSSYRSILRSFKLLNRGGILLVGGNSTSLSNISLDAMFRKSLSIVPIQYGTREDTKEFFSLEPINKHEW